MKAKEYAHRYIQASTEKKQECLISILEDFYKEIRHLIKVRNAKKDAAIYSIFDELNNKWLSFVNRVKDDLKPNGFKLFIKAFYPDVFTKWVAYNELIAGKPRKTSREIRSENCRELKKFCDIIREGQIC